MYLAWNGMQLICMSHQIRGACILVNYWCHKYWKFEEEFSHMGNNLISII